MRNPTCLFLYPSASGHPRQWHGRHAGATLHCTWPFTHRRRLQKSLDQIKYVRILLNNCWQLWNSQYTASNKATHYKLLFPHVARTLQYPLPPKIFRLCTGHCQLNGHLHKLGLHLDGRCDTCGTSETVEHYLIHCSKFNRQRTAFTSNIRVLQINFDWITILRTPTAQRYILYYLKQTGKPVW